MRRPPGDRSYSRACVQLLPGLLLSICCACSSVPDSRYSVGQVSAADVKSVAHQPLRDLDLERQEIPIVLLDAAHAPYAPPSAYECGAIASEILALDTVLGPDIDTTDWDAGKDTAASVLVDSARDAATSWIPLRGLVRRVTGAEHHSRQVAAATLAGSVRRGYLKGVGYQMRCVPPAPSAKAPS